MKTKETSSPKIKSGKKARKAPIFIILLAIIILAGTLYYFKGQFIVATVNGKPIWRFTLISELEKQEGKKVLDSLVTKTLILQEAEKQNVTVGDEEIDQEIKQLEENFAKQGQDLNQLLDLQGMTRDRLREQIKIQKIVEKIAGKDVNITDQEVDDYIEENKDSIPKDLDIEEIKENIKEQLRQQKINQKIQLWIESLHDKAKINYFLFH